MPKCDGRPDGPCPLKKNDKSVHLSQGDLMLCTACENFRFPVSAASTIAKAVHTSTTSSSTERQPTDRHDGTQLGGRGAVDNIVNEPAGAASNTTSMPTDSINRETNTKIVINELLTYVRFYRDRGNNAENASGKYALLTEYGPRFCMWNYRLDNRRHRLSRRVKKQKKIIRVHQTVTSDANAYIICTMHCQH